MSEKKTLERHKAQCLVDLLKEAKEHIDEEKIANILENRGRVCIGPAYIKKAKDATKDAKDINEFLNKLGKPYECYREGVTKSTWSIPNVTAMR